VWKICEAIIDTWIRSKIQLHNILHGFIQLRGTSTTIMEAKLQQEVAALMQEILLQVYLDLTKACDALDQDRTLKTLAEYGVGPRLLCLIKHYWDNQKIAPRQRGHHGPIIIPESGTIQGGLKSCVEFSIVVDAVIRYWLTLVIPHNAENGLGRNAEDTLTLFHANNGLLSAKDHERLQKALDVLVSLFEGIGLKTNATKTKLMICLPAPRATRMSDEACKQRMTDEGDSHRECQRR
jgi:hypothetical protein